MRTALLVIALCATTAHADRAKYSRKQNVVVPVNLSNRVKPIEPKAKPSTGPVATPDDIMLAQERQQPLRREQEAILEKLIKDAPDDDPEKPDYMFRLAEHYAQQLRFWRLKSIAPTIPSHAD